MRVSHEFPFPGPYGLFPEYHGPAVTRVVFRQGTRHIGSIWALVLLVEDTVAADDERHDT